MTHRGDMTKNRIKEGGHNIISSDVIHLALATLEEAESSFIKGLPESTEFLLKKAQVYAKIAEVMRNK